MRAPNHLSKEEKKIWRHLHEHLVELKHFHAIDVSQLEMACRLIHDNRRMAAEVAVADFDTAGLALRRMFHDSCSKVNTVCDKLGISYAKRNPYKEKRGRSTEPHEKAHKSEENVWMKVLNDVPAADRAREAN